MFTTLIYYFVILFLIVLLVCEKKLRGYDKPTKYTTVYNNQLPQSDDSNLETKKKELEQIIKVKNNVILSLNTKLKEKETSDKKLEKEINDFRNRIEELEEEVEIERRTRTEIEKQRELEQLCEHLEKAGGTITAQIEFSKNCESEIHKLSHDLQNASIKHDDLLSNLNRKHNEIITTLSTEIELLKKTNAKAEKEKNEYLSELNNLKYGLNHIKNEKVAQEKIAKQLQTTLKETEDKLHETNRTLSDFDSSKKKLSMENSDLLRQLDEAESQVSQLSRVKISLNNQLEETKSLADEESRERSTLLSKYRSMEHDINILRAQIEEETDGKIDIQCQLSKANNESHSLQCKLDSEDNNRSDELKEAKRKLQNRLSEAEETIESLNQKCVASEKTKKRLATEIEDLQLQVEHATAIFNAAEKKQKAFDKIISEWKLKVDELVNELDASQIQCRNYSTELIRLKGSYGEAQEQLEIVRRDNRVLANEVKDLLNEMGEDGRCIYDVEKARKRLEAEKEELQTALGNAEYALELEENKVIRIQLELSQVRQEIDYRIREKEEEFESTKNNYKRAINSMEASFDPELKGKSEAYRMKIKMEADITELQIALEHANKTNEEAQKNIKRYKHQLKDIQIALEEEQHAHEDVRMQLAVTERNANVLKNELENTRTLLENGNRDLKQAEQELGDANEQLNEAIVQNTYINSVKRKLESDLEILHSNLKDHVNEAKSSEEKALKAMADASRLSDKLREEQEHAETQEKLCKKINKQIKELQSRCDDTEANALKGGKRTIQKLEQRTLELEDILDVEQKKHADTQRSLHKTQRRVKELNFQTEEDRKNLERMQDFIDKLQNKIKLYKKQIIEAEEMAALNLSKYRKAQQDFEEAEERAISAEKTIFKYSINGGRSGSSYRSVSASARSRSRPN